MSKKFEVIIPTYNNPFALNLTLTSLLHQNRHDFSICIADDGSKKETADLVEKWISILGCDRLRSVWHPDEGFQKNKILNKAIESSSSDYLIFIDGDCIAAPWFIERHIRQSKTGYFLSGGVIRMPEAASPFLNEEIIFTKKIFSKEWLNQHHCLSTIGDYLKASFVPIYLASFLEKITPVKCTWNGGNSSGWREDLINVNGFDESMSYGAEDVELGIRLNNLGIKSKHVRYSATLLHIEHPRSYAKKELFLQNKQRIKEVKKSGSFWNKQGIKNHSN